MTHQITCVKINIFWDVPNSQLMESVCNSEMSVSFCQPTWHNIPQDCYLQCTSIILTKLMFYPSDLLKVNYSINRKLTCIKHKTLGKTFSNSQYEHCAFKKCGYVKHNRHKSLFKCWQPNNVSCSCLVSQTYKMNLQTKSITYNTNMAQNLKYQM